MDAFQNLFRYLKSYFLLKPIASIVFVSLVLSGWMVAVYFNEIYYTPNLSLEAVYPYLFFVISKIIAFALAFIAFIIAVGLLFRFVFEEYHLPMFSPPKNNDEKNEILHNFFSKVVLPTYFFTTIFLVFLQYNKFFYAFPWLITLWFYGAYYLRKKKIGKLLSQLGLSFLFTASYSFTLLFLTNYLFIPAFGISSSTLESILFILWGSMGFAVFCFAIGISSDKISTKGGSLIALVVLFILFATIVVYAHRIVASSFNNTAHLPKGVRAALMINESAIKKVNFLTGRNISGQNGYSLIFPKFYSTVGEYNIEMQTSDGKFVAFTLLKEDAQKILISSQEISRD